MCITQMGLFRSIKAAQQKSYYIGCMNGLGIQITYGKTLWSQEIANVQDEKCKKYSKFHK